MPSALDSSNAHAQQQLQHAAAAAQHAAAHQSPHGLQSQAAAMAAARLQAEHAQRAAKQVQQAAALVAAQAHASHPTLSPSPLAAVTGCTPGLGPPSSVTSSGGGGVGGGGVPINGLYPVGGHTPSMLPSAAIGAHTPGIHTPNVLPPAPLGHGMPLGMNGAPGASIGAGACSAACPAAHSMVLNQMEPLATPPSHPQQATVVPRPPQ